MEEEEITIKGDDVIVDLDATLEDLYMGGSLKAQDCVYTLFIRTGSILKGGTDSVISLGLSDQNGKHVEITNLETWGGLMGPDYKYFERGNLDIFSGRAPCLTGPVCRMNLTSDGSGNNHGWYCNYVEVTASGVHGVCSQQLFTVEQWLATDVSPFELTAIKDNCPSSVVDNGKRNDDEMKSIAAEI